MAANTINEAILEAIKIVVDKNIQEAPADRTITATIIGCINAMSNEYRVDFQGGSFTALAKEGETYRTNQSVYVLVPEGDFSKTKRIIGLASLTKEDYNLTSVNSTINNYFTVGKNAIINENKENPFGVCSFNPIHYITLYDHSDSTKNKIIIDEADFKNSLNEAEGILLKGSFSTTLPFAHKKSNGSYGLLCVIAYEGETEDEYNLNLYDLNSSKMLGNPLSYPSFVSQQLIFEHEANQKFSHIDKIIFYCQDFVETKTDMKNNIFLKDLELFALKKIGATNGEYSLTLSTPNGITFEKNDLETSFLPIIAALKKKESKLDIGVQYYWFVEDARIVDSKHNEYNTYAGAGWRKLDNIAAKSSINIPKRICSAYKTKFLCVAVAYDTVTLKTEFNLYNDAHNMNIIIELDSKTNTFAYNTGKPTLTCRVLTQEGDNLDPSGENLYYLWSKIQQDKSEIIFNKTAEEIQAEIAELEETDFFTKASLETQLNYLKGVEFNSNNSISYPISKIDIAETLKCTVYSKKQNGVLYGSAKVLLKNGVDVNKNDYYIVIKNGEQVFQYSESGISPTSERVQEPLEILPLEAIFYAPDGTEIKNSGINSYSISWQFPAADNTLLESVGELDLNRTIETEVCSFKIKDEYNSQVEDNQIHCIIEYKGLKITGSTNFFFTKIGEDGTNGTDIVAKIEPEDNSSLATVFLDVNNNFYSLEESSGSLQGGSLGVKLRLFQRAQEIKNISPSWKWSTAKTTTLNILAVDSEGKITVNDIDNNQEEELKDIVLKSYLVLQGSCSYNDGVYYAHYPIPIIKNHFVSYDKNNTDLQKVNLTDLYVTEVSKKSLRSVLYNKDGKDPIYNNKIGITVNYSIGLNSSWSISANTFGEALEEECQIVSSEEKNSFTIFVSPKESYSGNKNNNLIYFKISNSTGKIAAEGWIPIHFSLNTYGLASLNAWDGNHIDINEDGAYIMAPQMGAGVKNNNNQFTGIVMGKAQFGDEQENVGLFGLKDGRQSIFLDAKTGAATFGLNDDDYNVISSSQKGQNCGRIHLDPEGESYISSWRIGRKSLYSVNGELTDNKTPLEEKHSHHPTNAIGSIPREKQGVILSSDPAFISVKGIPAIDKIKINEIDFYKGDSYEVLLDANNIDGSVFSVQKHTSELEESDSCQITNDSELFYKGQLIGSFSQSEGKGEESGEIILTFTYNVNFSQKDVFVLPFPIEIKTIDSTIDLFASSWKFLGIKYKKETDIGLLRNIVYAFNANGMSLENVQLKDKNGKSIELNLKDIIGFEWRAEETAGLDSEGNLNANAINRDKVGLKVGYVPAFGYNEKTKQYLGLDLSYNGDSFYRTFISSDSSKKDTLHISAVNRDNDFGKTMSFNAAGFTFATRNLVNNNQSFGYQEILNNNSLLGSFKPQQSNVILSSIEEYLYERSDEYRYSVYDKNNDEFLTLLDSGQENLYIRNDNDEYVLVERGNVFKKNEYTIIEKNLKQCYPQYERLTEEEDENKPYSLKYLEYCWNDNEKIPKIERQRVASNFDIEGTFDFPAISIEKIIDDLSGEQSYSGINYFSKEDNCFKDSKQSLVLSEKDNEEFIPIPFKEGQKNLSELSLYTWNNYVFNLDNSDFELGFYFKKGNQYELVSKDNTLFSYLDQKNQLTYKPYKDIIVKKEKVFNHQLLKDVTGGYLSLNAKDMSELHSDSRLKLSSLSKLEVFSETFNLNSHYSGFMITTKKIDRKNNDGNIIGSDYWTFEMNPSVSSNFGAAIYNNRTDQYQEGLFFTGARSGEDKTSLFSSGKILIQNVASNVNLTKKRSKLISSQTGMNIQAVGGYGLTLTAVPSTLKSYQASELLLYSTSSGFGSRFELMSPSGGIYSLYGKWSNIGDGTKSKQRQVIINAPLRVYSKNSKNKITYWGIHCGGLATHRNNITTGNKMGAWNDFVTSQKGGHIHTRGGSISTNGGNINTIKGNINTQGGAINTGGGAIKTGGGSVSLGSGDLTIGGSIKGTGKGVKFSGEIKANGGISGTFATFSSEIKANGGIRGTSATFDDFFM